MAQNPNALDFELATDDLVAHLPSWWQAANPTSVLHGLLAAAGAQLDALSELFEQPYLDQVITTASAAGLRRNFAYAYGVQREQLPTVTGQLLAYMQALGADDGSLSSLVNVLTTMVDTPINTTGGTVLTFPSGGGGLTFPSSGAGLALYEFALGNQPSTTQGLLFPVDGSGLVFPVYPGVMTSDNMIVSDGSIPTGAGPGLVFAGNEFVQLQPNCATSQLVVQVQSWMSFDRPAFARAVNRARPADWLAPVVQEVSEYH